MSANLPAHWIRKPSKSHNGKYFYFNTATGASQWHSPTENSGNTSKLAKRLIVHPTAMKMQSSSSSNNDKLRKLNPKSCKALFIFYLKNFLEHFSNVNFKMNSLKHLLRIA